MRRVVFTGDCLRSEAGEANQWSNVAWLQNLLGERLQRITGLPVESVLPAPTECWQALGQPPSLSNWSRFFWAEADQRLCEVLHPYFDDALVVAIELSPILESALNRLRIPWVEVGVHALRFLPDFALFFRFSPGLTRPDRFGLTPAEVAAGVARLRAFYGAAPISGTVFFAQTNADRTLITRSGFFDPMSILDDLCVDSARGPLWVKPHPLEPGSAVVQALLERGARALTHNTYATLGAEVEVATIASSVAIEARAFGRSVRVFNPEVLDRNSTALVTLNGFRSSAFWREALTGFALTDAEFDEPFVPNLLRARLNFYSLDRDVYPQPPVAAEP